MIFLSETEDQRREIMDFISEANGQLEPESPRKPLRAPRRHNPPPAEGRCSPPKRDRMHHQLLTMLLMIVLAFTHGCGTADKVRARKDMENSQAVYKRCLEQYPDDPSRCEALRRAYEADVQAYSEASKGVSSPSSTIFIEYGPGGSRK